MTTPFSVDHPDWGRSVSAADIQVFRFSNVQAAAIVTHGRFFTGNLPWLFLFFSPAVTNGRVTLTWFQDETAPNSIGTWSADANANQSAVGPIANQGPWVRIQTTLLAVPNTVTIEVWSTLVPATDTEGNAGNDLLTVTGTNVPAFTTSNFNASSTRWGWGHWTGILDDATSYRIRLLSVSYDGTLQQLTVRHHSMSDPGGLILLPTRPVRLEVLNNDAAAHAFWGDVLFHVGPV